ncbi:hypothetical protein D9M69_617870 [compost metagenome]
MVFDASMPGRWAAPPAPATIAVSPRPAALSAYANSASGIRWAETTFASWLIPNCWRISTAWRIVSQSEFEPITTPT